MTDDAAIIAGMLTLAETMERVNGRAPNQARENVATRYTRRLRELNGDV